jgi:hypothetical protein
MPAKKPKPKPKRKPTPAQSDTLPPEQHVAAFMAAIRKSLVTPKPKAKK